MSVLVQAIPSSGQQPARRAGQRQRKLWRTNASAVSRSANARRRNNPPGPRSSATEQRIGAFLLTGVMLGMSAWFVAVNASRLHAVLLSLYHLAFN